MWFLHCVVAVGANETVEEAYTEVGTRDRSGDSMSDAQRHTPSEPSAKDYPRRWHNQCRRGCQDVGGHRTCQAIMNNRVLLTGTGFDSAAGTNAGAH